MKFKDLKVGMYFYYFHDSHVKITEISKVFNRVYVGTKYCPISPISCFCYGLDEDKFPYSIKLEVDLGI